MTEIRNVDYHCHLDLYPDYEAQFRRCAEQNVEVFSMTTTPLAWEKNKELSRTAPNIRIGLGIHPQIVGTKEADIALFERLIDETRYVGEVGLDAGPRFYKNYALQKEVFERVLKASARSGNKILSLHTVRTGSQVLKMIEEHFPESAGRVVLHWFSGSVAEAKRARDYGCWFSINESMGRSENGRRIIQALPIDRLLTETDGPFTESKPGVPTDPWDVSRAAKMIAEIKGITEAEMRSRVWQNLLTLES
ncbi:MAG: TatD family hydrolase [Chthoniobacter sp.]|nr:TatD family hydrolase [Chthoniobacter sp.]